MVFGVLRVINKVIKKGEVVAQSDGLYMVRCRPVGRLCIIYLVGVRFILL